jgi:RNA polymerase sigma-70 factor, ECF subfamily
MSPSTHTPANDEAFVQLLSRHEPVVRAYLRGLVATIEDVDTLMPEVALVAWRKFAELEDRSAFAKWACVIARYEVLRHRRDQARDRLVLDEDVIVRLAAEAEDETLQTEAQMRALESCLQKLPEDRRKLVLGCYGPGVSIKDIAARTGRSEDGLYQLLRRIRLELLRCVESVLKNEVKV